MHSLQQKVDFFIQPINYNDDSLILYTSQIISKSAKEGYPKDLYSLYYRRLYAISLNAISDFDHSKIEIDKILFEFSDTLKKYSEIEIELLMYQLSNYYWLQNVDDYTKLTTSYLKLIRESNSSDDYIVEVILKFAIQLADFNKFEDALELYNLINEEYYKAYQSNTLHFLSGQQLLARVQIKRGQFKGALETCNQIIGVPNLGSAYQIRQFKISKTTSLVGLDKYKEALELNSEIITELKIDNTDNNVDTLAFTYIQHASIYNHIGNYLEARRYYEMGLNIFETISQNSNKMDYAWALAHYAGFLQETGNPSEALEKNLAALEIRKTSSEENRFQIINLLNSLAENYFSLGDYYKAVLTNENALSMCLENYDKSYPITYQTMSNLAVMHSSLGNYNRALELDLEVLEIKRKISGDKSLDFSNSLNNVACVYTSLGDYEKAKEYQQNAIRIRKEFLGENSSLVALSLSNLALVHSNLGEFQKSIYLNKKAVEIYEHLGLFTNNYTTTLDNLAISYAKSNNLELAYLYALKSFFNNLSIYNENQGLNDNLSLLFKNYLNSSEQLTLNLFLKSENHGNTLYENIINAHGRLYKSNINQFENSKFIQNDVQAEELLELKKLKERLLISSQNSINFSENEIQRINEQINLLESKLNKVLSANFKHINPHLITNYLQNDEVFIDIVAFKKYDFNNSLWTDSTSYLLFISDKFDTIVDIVNLTSCNQFYQDIFENYRYQTTSINYKTDLKDSIFYKYLWQPISKKIGNPKTIYISMAGDYNNINLNTIYNPETGKYLVEEYDIRMVNSARDFIQNKEKERIQYTTKTAVLFGYPNFDGNLSSSIDTTVLITLNRDLSSFWIDSITRGGMKVNPLPGTKKEVANISSTLNSNSWNVVSYTENNATESNLKKISSPRVLHIATHGYFFSDIPQTNSNNHFLGMSRSHVIQDPMLRSGLLFAGANKTLNGETPNTENGLLSAAEASLLDLSQTELVVLSACETGRGEETNSEGVYGLRKAFADAGAQNIIMSLWKVDDRVTQEFMSRFYEVWLIDKTTIREAFNRTQLEIKSKYPEPYYWGAFVLVGE